MRAPAFHRRRPAYSRTTTLPNKWPRLYQDDARVAENIRICEACPEHGVRHKDGKPFCKLIVDDAGRPTQCCNDVFLAVNSGRCLAQKLVRPPARPSV